MPSSFCARVIDVLCPFFRRGHTSSNSATNSGRASASPAVIAGGRPWHGVSLNMILHGECGVGKTSLRNRWVDGTFTGDVAPTFGVDFNIKTLELVEEGGQEQRREGQEIMDSICVDGRTVKKDRPVRELAGGTSVPEESRKSKKRAPCAELEVKINVYDTSGKPSYREVNSTYLLAFDAVIFVYDISSVATLNELRRYFRHPDHRNKLQARKNDGTAMLLVGNKCDVPLSQRQVGLQTGQDTAAEFGISFMEVSAKRGTNVREMFMSVATHAVTEYMHGSRSSDGCRRRARGVAGTGTLQRMLGVQHVLRVKASLSNLFKGTGSRDKHKQTKTRGRGKPTVSLASPATAAATGVLLSPHHQQQEREQQRQPLLATRRQRTPRGGGGKGGSRARGIRGGGEMIQHQRRTHHDDAQVETAVKHLPEQHNRHYSHQHDDDVDVDGCRECLIPVSPPSPQDGASSCQGSSATDFASQNRSSSRCNAVNNTSTTSRDGGDELRALTAQDESFVVAGEEEKGENTDASRDILSMRSSSLSPRRYGLEKAHMPGIRGEFSTKLKALSPSLTLGRPGTMVEANAAIADASDVGGACSPRGRSRPRGRAWVRPPRSPTPASASSAISNRPSHSSSRSPTPSSQSRPLSTFTSSIHEDKSRPAHVNPISPRAHLNPKQDIVPAWTVTPPVSGSTYHPPSRHDGASSGPARRGGREVRSASPATEHSATRRLKEASSFWLDKWGVKEAKTDASRGRHARIRANHLLSSSRGRDIDAERFARALSDPPPYKG